MRLKRKFVLPALVLSIMCLSAMAQAPQNTTGGMKTVKGYVLDANGSPLPGATVQIEGSDKGVLTDLDGAYEIKVSSGQQLTYSFIGMQPRTVKVTDQTVLNIELSDDKTQIEDAVVVAFGTQKKESVVGAITTISPAELKVPSSDLTTSLAGNFVTSLSSATK